MLCMIDPQFLAPNGASSLWAIAIGLLAETFSVLIINLFKAILDTETGCSVRPSSQPGHAPQHALPHSYAGSAAVANFGER